MRLEGDVYNKLAELVEDDPRASAAITAIYEALQASASSVPSEDDWMTVPEISEYSKHHTKTILKALRRGELVGYQRRESGPWRIRRKNVDAWMTGQGKSARRRAA